MTDTYYEILGVPITAQPGEIKAKYRKLIQQVHPDLNGPPSRFLQIQEAYEVLADPARRAAYDRFFRASGEPAEVLAADAVESVVAMPIAENEQELVGQDQQAVGQDQQDGQDAPGRSPQTETSRVTASSTRLPRQADIAARRSFVRLSLLNQHIAFAVTLVGVELLIVGYVLPAVVGRAVIGLGVVTLIVAFVAAVGGRGAREREAYRRSGMAAVDAMTGRQFVVLLEHFFTDYGYRVARLGSRADLGADLILDSGHGRTVVQVRGGTGVVRDDAVQRAVVAKNRYRARWALLVTSSNFSERAVAVAGTNGVALWNRAVLAAELPAMRQPAAQSGVERFRADLRAGSRICRGSVAAAFVDSSATKPRTRQQQVDRRAS